MQRSWLYEDLNSYLEQKIQSIPGTSTLLTSCLRMLVAVPVIVILAITALWQYLELVYTELRTLTATPSDK